MKQIYLENTSNGHNKFYRMTEISAYEWEAEYGKIGNSPSKIKYSYTQWDKKYQEKINKGYIEITNSSFPISPALNVKQPDTILDRLNMLHDLVINAPIMNENDLKYVTNLIYKHSNLDNLSKSEMIKLNEIYKMYKK